MNAFDARYPGACGECHEWFPAGTSVVYDAAGVLIHAECPPPAELTVTGTPCPRCWCYHSGECA